MAKMSAKFDLGQIKQNIGVAEDKFDRAMKGATAYHATEGVKYMKENAPWTDRTTAARNGLFTVPRSTDTKHEITFSHTVPYGIWLEIANSGKYEIIMPSVRHIGNLYMQRLRGLLGKMR